MYTNIHTYTMPTNVVLFLSDQQLQKNKPGETVCLSVCERESVCVRERGSEREVASEREVESEKESEKGSENEVVREAVPGA